MKKRVMPKLDNIAGSKAAVIARQNRAQLKVQLRTGDTPYLDCLEQAWTDRECVAASLRTKDFLLTLPAVGKVKVARILDDLDISPRRKLGGLGKLQRRKLQAFVIGWIDHIALRRAQRADK